MSLGHSPKLITNGLVMNLDAGNPSSLTNVTKNLFINPESFGTAGWTSSFITRYPNNITAPDGTLTASLFIEDNTTNQHLISQNIGTVVVGTKYTYSLYAKSYGDNRLLTMTYHGGSYPVFDLAAGIVVTKANFDDATITSVGNGWYRCTVTAGTFLSTGTFYTGSWNGTTTLFTGTGNSGFYLWGPQLEFGTQASTYYAPNVNPRSNNWTDLTGNLSAIPNLKQVEVLVVAGGGGGAATGSGGGAGGLVYNSSLSVLPGISYSANVGNGGRGGSFLGDAAALAGLGAWVQGVNGENSTFASITTIGGGGGVYHGSGTGAAGGSGSGGSVTTAGLTPTGGAATTGQGNPGGTGYVDASWNGTHGGGGGAGKPGAPGGNVLGSGNGGDGLAYDISGTLTYYAGGGGSGEVNGTYVGRGGLGGGGSGVFDRAGTDATPNTGGGGGGGGYGSGGGGFNGLYTPGGTGGSGIIIVRYDVPVRASGGVITIANNKVMHTYTSGNSTFEVFRTSAELVNNVPYSSNGYITLNGTSQYVSAPYLNLSTWTLSMWVKPLANISSNYHSLVTTGYVRTGDKNSINYFIDTGLARTNGVFQAGSYNVGADHTVVSTTTANSVVGIWTNLVCTRDNNNTVSLYVNGKLEGSSTFSSFDFASSSNEFLIGSLRDNYSYGRYLKMQVGSVQLYNRALANTEVFQNYSTTRGRFAI